MRQGCVWSCFLWEALRHPSFVGFLAARIAASFSTRLRDDIFHSVLNFSDAEIKKFSIPSLLTRTTNDITNSIGFHNGNPSHY